MAPRAVRSMLAPALAVIVLSSCRDAVPPIDAAGNPSSQSPSFGGELVCPDGEEAGGAGWDYGPDPRGITRDAVGWVRTHATGIDETLTLALLTKAGDRDNVVVASRPDGTVLAFVDFGVDDRGRYFPGEAEACRSSGIEDFNGTA
jgi:hypothetical protein